MSGQWLVCQNPDLVERHAAKVYGKAEVGAPPMSVPHLDTRIINGKKALLFGPYAGFSTKFLKHGSLLDLPESLQLDNILPMLSAGLHNLPLTKYLIDQVRQSPEDRLAEVETTMKLARSLKWVERIPEAEANFAAADRKLIALKPLWPAEKQSVLVVYRSNLVRGWSEHLQFLGKHDKPRELLAESVADLQKALRKEPTNIRLRRGLAADAIALGRSQMELGEWRESIRSSELALTTVREMLGPNPPTRETSRIHPPGIQLAEVLFRAPAPWTDVPRALVLDRELIAIAEKLVSVDPANGRYRFLLANVLSGHGEHLRASWRWPEALSFYDRAVTEAEAVLVKAPDNAYYQDMLGTAIALRGQLRFDMHDDQPAQADLTRGAAILEKGVTAGRHFLDPQFHFAKDYLAILARERK